MIDRIERNFEYLSDAVEYFHASYEALIDSKHVTSPEFAKKSIKLYAKNVKEQVDTILELIDKQSLKGCKTKSPKRK